MSGVADRGCCGMRATQIPHSHKIAHVQQGSVADDITIPPAESKTK